MLRFEIKKIFSRTRNRVAVAFLLVVLVVVSMLTINMVEYTDENGESSTGIAAARELRAEKNAHAGYITGDVLAEAVRENDAINSSPEALSDDIRQQNIAYGEKQGIEDILSLINQAFSPWREYNYYAADSVTEEEARTVYDRRVSNLEDVLDSGQETVNADEREYLTDKYRELETPFYYEYFDGWSALLMYGNTYILILALVTGCLTAGIFSDEFRLKTDSVFFSTRLGRSGGTRAKLAAGVIIATGVYVTFSILYTFIVLAVLGADGARPYTAESVEKQLQYHFLTGIFADGAGRVHRHFADCSAGDAGLRGDTDDDGSHHRTVHRAVRGAVPQQDSYTEQALCPVSR